MHACFIIYIDDRSSVYFTVYSVCISLRHRAALQFGIWFLVFFFFLVFGRVSTLNYRNKLCCTDDQVLETHVLIQTCDSCNNNIYLDKLSIGTWYYTQDVNWITGFGLIPTTIVIICYYARSRMVYDGCKHFSDLFTI